MWLRGKMTVRLLTLLLTCLFLALSASAQDQAADDLRPPRLKPTARGKMAILPWEHNSTAPWGDSRLGGDDQRTFAFSPDGKRIAAEDAGGWQIEVWDVASGKSRGRFGRIDDPAAVAFSPDGKAILTAGHNFHDICSVELWDAAAGKRLRSLDEDVNTTPFTAVAFSPDGKAIALAAGFGRRAPAKLGIHVWDVASGDERRRFDGPEPSAEADRPRWRSRLFDALCFFPDGRSLALVGDNRVWLWEFANGKERCLLGLLPSAYARASRDESRPACVAVSPDGRSVAVGCPDGAVRLFDVASGQPLPPLAAHDGWVRAVAFSPDGKSLVSLGADNQVLTWPLDRALRPWRPKQDRLSAAAVARLWKDLLDGDPLTAYAAVRNLAARPAQALELLRDQVKPVPAVDSEQVARLVKALSQEDFNARKRAAIELRRYADLALPALRAASDRSIDGVLKRVCERLEAQYPTPEQLRALRALQVLELMGTPEARKMLGELAGGAAESLLTGRAKSVLARLEKGGPPGAAATPPKDPWGALADEDAARAFAAMRFLWVNPHEAVPLLRERMGATAIRDVFDDDPRRIARLIGQLDNDVFAEREKASMALASLGAAAEPALRKALGAEPSQEARVRMEAVLKDLNGATVSPERLRVLRALEVLEGIGDDKARKALEVVGEASKSRWMKAMTADALQRARR